MQIGSSEGSFTLPAADARAWIRGTLMLPEGDVIAYLAEMPEDDLRTLVKAHLTRPIEIPEDQPLARALSGAAVAAAAVDASVDRATPLLKEWTEDRLWEIAHPQPEEKEEQ